MGRKVEKYLNVENYMSTSYEYNFSSGKRYAIVILSDAIVGLNETVW
jgi:hypothetical protein